MKRIVLFVALLVLSIHARCFALTIFDSFDTLDRSFWDFGLHGGGVSTDPITGTGSVLHVRAGNPIEHAFDGIQYGTVSLDIYVPYQEPDTMLQFSAGSESLRARRVAFYQDPFLVELCDAEFNTVPRIDMQYWHNYSMVLTETGTVAYVDGNLVGASSYSGGFDSVSFYCGSAAHGGYIDNFQYMPAYSPVPEPETYMLLGSGLLGMIVLARKRFHVPHE